MKKWKLKIKEQADKISDLAVQARIEQAKLNDLLSDRDRELSQLDPNYVVTRKKATETLAALGFMVEGEPMSDEALMPQGSSAGAVPTGEDIVANLFD